MQHEITCLVTARQTDLQRPRHHPRQSLMWREGLYVMWLADSITRTERGASVTTCQSENVTQLHAACAKFEQLKPHEQRAVNRKLWTAETAKKELRKRRPPRKSVLSGVCREGVKHGGKWEIGKFVGTSKVKHDEGRLALCCPPGRFGHFWLQHSTFNISAHFLLERLQGCFGAKTHPAS